MIRALILNTMLLVSWVLLRAIGVGPPNSLHRLGFMFFLIIPPIACAIAYTLGQDDRGNT